MVDPLLIAMQDDHIVASPAPAHPASEAAKPLSVECPTCHSQPFYACVSEVGQVPFYHPRRFIAAAPAVVSASPSSESATDEQVAIWNAGNIPDGWQAIDKAISSVIARAKEEQKKHAELQKSHDALVEALEKSINAVEEVTAQASSCMSHVGIKERAQDWVRNEMRIYAGHLLKEPRAALATAAKLKEGR